MVGRWCSRDKRMQKFHVEPHTKPILRLFLIMIEHWLNDKGKESQSAFQMHAMSKCGNCLWSNIIVFLYRNPFCSEMVQNNCGHFCCAAKLRINFSLYQSSIRFVLWTHDQLQYWFEISVDYGTDIDISICVYRIYRGEKTPIKPTPINQRTQYFACMPVRETQPYFLYYFYHDCNAVLEVCIVLRFSLLKSLFFFKKWK